MKDSEFIELLNLYLDHEISAADAARLEAEIRGNLERRRVYLQYCKMQQACRAIAADFATADASDGISTEKKVIPFTPAFAATPARQRSRQFSYAIGAVAAAACCVRAWGEASPFRTNPASAVASWRAQSDQLIASPCGCAIGVPSPCVPAAEADWLENPVPGGGWCQFNEVWRYAID